MKKLLALLLLFSPSVALADINHSIQNVVSVSTLGASSTSNRVGTTFSASGTNVTPTAGDTANAAKIVENKDTNVGIK